MKKRGLKILTGYRHLEVGLYTPKRNKKRLGLLIGFIFFCLITPFTNWMIPLVLKGISKFNPLWIYK